MFCSRCGTENEPGDRFCSNCGAALRATKAQPSERAPLGHRLARLVGTDRRTRIVTGVTLLALVVAIVSFVALDSGDEEIPRDGYTLEAERICIEAKNAIVAAEAKGGDTGQLARRLLPVIAAWRSDFRARPVPNDRLEEAMMLDGALLDAEIEIGALARASAEGTRREVLAAAGRVDAAATRVEDAVSELALDRCARRVLGLSGQGNG